MTTAIPTIEKKTAKQKEKVSENKDIIKTKEGTNPPRDFKKQPENKNRNIRRRNRRIVRREDRKEFDQKIISIRRVTRVVAGGRRFSFSVAIVIGDKKGKVGVGSGKAGDTTIAIEKAVRQAKKNMRKIRLTNSGSIAHDVEAKYCASCVSLRPAKGRGIVAGSSARTVLELAGIKDVSAKVFSRSKNRLNNAQATMKALDKLSD